MTVLDLNKVKKKLRKHGAKRNNKSDYIYNDDYKDEDDGND